MKSHNLAYIPALDHLRLLAALLVRPKEKR